MTDRLRFLLSLLWQHLPSYLAGVVLMGATLWMSLAIPRYLEAAIDLLQQEGTADGAFMSRVWWILAFAVAIMFTRTGSRLFFFVPGRRVEYDLKNRLLEHLLTLQRGFFLRNPSGAIISRINNDINGVRMMMGFGLMQLTNAAGMLTLAPYHMYAISPWLTLYCALPILVAFALLQIGLRRLRAWQMRQMEALQHLSDFTVESYNGVDVLRSYRAYGWAETAFSRLSRDVRDANIAMSNIRAYLMPVLQHVVNGLKVLLVLVGGLMVIRAEMTMGQLMAYALYLTLLVPPLMGMTFMMFVLQRGMTALNSLEAIFHTRPEVPPVDATAEAALPRHMEQGLAVRGLTHAFADDPDHPVLHDVSFAVRPGEIVGLFGTIGSGKSTLVHLLNRYLEPPPDTVFLDGVDITRVSLHRLRRHIVTVTQEPFLFSDSIRENIRFAADETDEAVLAEAVTASALDADLARFPDHLETLVGERGITLSGGQKQRISLARSIMKPCDVLILDDVLSAVDHETERYLIEQIYGFRHARALLIVSHRISALERADRIVVLDEGRVTHVGTHAELVAAEGPYREAYLLQSERAETAADDDARATSAAAS